MGPMTPSAIAADNVFRLEGVQKRYGEGDAAVLALRGVDLDVARGELIVLLGPSGSGKSTLLNILGGLDRPSAGHAWFGDLDLAEAPDDAITHFRRHHVGFVFQFYNLIASLTAEENVELVTEVADDPMSAVDALALRAPSPSARKYCCAMNPRERLTSPRVSVCWRRSSLQTAIWAPPRC
jgi:putative ABC transport system ATP-binding protein